MYVLFHCEVSLVGKMLGWPVVQVRVLQELIYSAKRMGNHQLAIRYITILICKPFYEMQGEKTGLWGFQTRPDTFTVTEES